MLLSALAWSLAFSLLIFALILASRDLGSFLGRRSIRQHRPERWERCLGHHYARYLTAEADRLDRFPAGTPYRMTLNTQSKELDR